MNFELPENMLDEIQANIETIINSFDIPDDNKLDVIKKINFMYSSTKQLSATDALTGLYNRRHFESNFERELLRAKRYNSKLSIAVIDIDYFKNVNDIYGHSAGDYVLKEVAYIALNTIRTTDMLFRYGGEEFVIILTETPREGAVIPLERLRASVENRKFCYKNQEIKVTVSIGLSSDTSAATPCEMFDLADKALYKAKEAGRNRIEY
ncbi:MAG: GGDEF domain-containing protein [Heliobacteriaceae bacterium]|jgi:diguanylate cyclase (GGDEF)-like protein|nr:GGDEF domain-containing protein [Heliobacteriaceae bacterium]